MAARRKAIENRAKSLRGPASRYPTVARLHHAVASHLAGVLKPDPAIYRAVEKASGMKARWQSENSLIDAIKSAKSQLEEANREA
jgi:FMN phosphatase YigB (HAD superfamily)